MTVDYRKEFSPALGRDMEFKVYGTSGTPLLVFPTSQGRFYQYEDSGMVEALSDWVDRGELQIWAIDGIDDETFFASHGDVERRLARHDQYFAYVRQEMLPQIRREAPGRGRGVVLTGCSMGAYHAANYFFRFPQGVSGVVALSGVYSTRSFFGDDVSGSRYLNSPLHCLPRLTDQGHLAALRAARLVFCCGQGAWEDEMLDETRRLEAVLGELGVEAWFDYWGRDANHDWPWWQKQIRHFLGSWFDLLD